MTLVLKRSELANDFVTGGQDTVGVRVPDHVVALALLEAFEKVGGKGVATALGVLLGISWILGLAAAATWLIMAYFFRYSSLASITAALIAPVYYVFADGTAWFMNKGVLVGVSAMSLLLIYRHAENLGRLAKGTESRLGKKASAHPAPHKNEPKHAHDNKPHHKRKH